MSSVCFSRKLLPEIRQVELCENDAQKSVTHFI